MHLAVTVDHTPQMYIGRCSGAACARVGFDWLGDVALPHHCERRLFTGFSPIERYLHAANSRLLAACVHDNTRV